MMNFRILRSLPVGIEASIRPSVQPAVNERAQITCPTLVGPTLFGIALSG
jgi:hypothetical protein